MEAENIVKHGLEHGFILPMTKHLQEAIDLFMTPGEGVEYTSPHPGETCPQYLLQKIPEYYWNGAKVYAPVHSALMIIQLIRHFRNKESKHSVYEIVKHALLGLLKSTMFAGGMATGFGIGGCYLKDVLGKVTPNRVFLLAFTFGFSFLFESSRRWGEMSIWVLANWFQGVNQSNKKMKIKPLLPHSEVVSR